VSTGRENILWKTVASIGTFRVTLDCLRGGTYDEGANTAEDQVN
jgi:hypothetical protein